MLGQLGFSEIMILLLIILIVFGAKRLPEMGAAMGKGIREFKRNLKDMQSSIDGGSEEQVTSRSSVRQMDAPPSGGEPKKLSQ